MFGFLKKKDAAYYLEKGEEALKSGQLDEAEKSFANAIELAEEKKQYKISATSTFKLGIIAEQQDKIAIAEKHLSKALRHYQDLEQFEDAADCLLRLGIVCFKQRRLGESTQVFGTARKYYQDEREDHPGVAESLTWLARSCMEEKHFPMAEKHARIAISAIESQRGKDDESLALLWKLVGQCCVEQDKSAEAKEAFESSVAIYDKHSSSEKRLELCSCLHAYGRLLVKLEKKAEAKQAMQRASQICEEMPGYFEEAELATDLSKLN